MSTISPQQVVVGFDFNVTARAAMAEALALATREPSRVLHFLCVIDPKTPIPGIPPFNMIDFKYAEQVQQALTREIQAELAGRQVVGRIHFFVYARIGAAAEEILALAMEVGADLIVIGGHAHAGEEHVELGAVAKAVLRDAGCTVEVARPKAYEHVDLLKVVDAPAHEKYAPPHRYSYEETRMELRPRDWPLF